jgi:hypothetical protein
LEAWKFAINELCKTFTKEQLAEQVISQRELAAMYRKDNDVLRNANESLMYLIAKYQIEEEQKHD